MCANVNLYMKNSVQSLNFPQLYKEWTENSCENSHYDHNQHLFDLIIQSKFDFPFQ